MGIGKLLKKGAKAIVKNRKLLLTAATLIAPGVVAKAATKVSKLKRKGRDVLD